MTPAARYQAAIEILDSILAGSAAEPALASWSRRSRFAGSKDRAAVRDHVFQALRCKRSYAVLGGAAAGQETGRHLILGALRATGADIASVFSGEGHAPAPLASEELLENSGFSHVSQEVDLPEWLWPIWQRSLGEKAEATARALQSRAAVHLRVNLGKSSREAAAHALLQGSIVTEAHGAASAALVVTDGARKVKNSQAYLEGLVELQDAASQAIVEALPLSDGQRVLDYCAGGGGKSLAMAARASVQVTAHDVHVARMKDIAPRAKRAGIKIRCLSSEAIASEPPFDLVLCDAPCSGSGSWRRDPEGKWSLTAKTLDQTVALQASILDQARHLVRPGGVLAYATCSMLDVENDAQVRSFIERHHGWVLEQETAWFVSALPSTQSTDGFFVAVLRREK